MRRAKPEYPLGFRILTGVIGWVVPWFLRLWFWTCRITVIRPHLERQWLSRGSPASVGTMWHHNFIFYAWYFERRRFLVMSSRSKDGEIMVRIMRQMGYRHVRGSSSRGGREALYDLVQLAKEGWTAGIVADGPKGPPQVAKIGAVLAASHAGIPVLPTGAWCAKAKHLRNWDRTAIPYPFSRIFLTFGPPMHIPPDLDAAQTEMWRKRVEDEMTRVEKEAETIGRRILKL